MGAYSYYYEIRPIPGKRNCLLRIEPIREVELAFADDSESLLRLRRMKLLFEQSRMPLPEIRAAEDNMGAPRRKQGSNWASNGASRRIS